MRIKGNQLFWRVKLREETKKRWRPISECAKLRKWRRRQKIKRLLIGIIILLIALLLSSCKSVEYVYVEVPREPITCIDRIKTPLDMAKCLAEYQEKY